MRLVLSAIIGVILALAAGPSLAEDICPQKKDFTTPVTINIVIAETEYDFSFTQDSLTALNAGGVEEWLAKNALETAWQPKHLRTTGLTRGGIGMEILPKFTLRKTELFGEYACVFVESLIINLIYESTIYITKEVQDKACKFDAVMEHEQNHHKINQAIVRQMAKKIEKDIQHIISDFEGDGEIYYEDLEKKADIIKGGLEDFLRVYLDKLGEQADYYNDSLDSPAEYKRVSKTIHSCE